MFYSRGGRLAIVLIFMVALAVMSPVMFGMMSGLMESMKEMLPDDDQYAQMADMFTTFSASDMIMYTIEYVAGIGSIVILFLFKGAAGGEQTRRSVIIPQCSGLTAERYALPKFLIYPFSILIISAAAVIAGAGTSLLFFPGDLDWSMVLLAALCTGVYLAFSTAMQFTIGICTGRANVAVVIVIVLNMILPSILGLFRVDRFNPFALQSIALTAARESGETGNALLAAAETVSSSSDLSTLNICVSLGTAVSISILLYFVTVFILHTKEVHNEGNEPVL